mgnify:CR=1 FL=1
MISASSTTETRLRFAGIKVRTESGKPAKVYTDDQPIQVTTDSGTGEGTVENVGEYTEGDKTGTTFDLVVKNATAGASVLTLSADADADSGEVRPITLEVNLTTTEPEAASFDVPAPVSEPIA